jgi:phage host-nuclease inhibitor protein Gam
MATRPGTRKRKVEAAQDFNEVGEKERQIAGLLALIAAKEEQVTKRIQQIENEAVEQLRMWGADVIALSKAIEAYAEANKEALTAKTQTVPLPHGGMMQWYSTPPAVKFKKDEVDEIIKRIKALKLRRFLRVKSEINKEAMLEHQALATTIAGISITTDEKFVIRAGHRPEKIEHNLTTNRRQIVTPKTEEVAQAAE